ncbi:unnamed protein product [Rhodiola kirilowii]
MTQPKGYIDRNLPNHCCLLNRSIYGLKQSPRQWNKKFNDCMMSLGFARSNYDTCLYLRRLKHETVSYVLLYVDDILIISNSKPEITSIKTDLSKHFDMKDMGFAQKILGIKLFRDRISGKMFLSQVDYVNKVLDKFSMKHAKSTSIPLGGHLIFSKDDCPKTELEKQEMHDIPYDVAVGSVMYAMLCTRPDLGFAISVLSRYMSNPGKQHWEAMKYLLKYLVGTNKLGLCYANHEPSADIVGYVDSYYASNKDNRKSTTSFYFTWNGNCISWKSQLQSIVVLSSTEAEYIAATEAAKEAIWLSGLLKEITGFACSPKIYMDSQSALCLCKDPVYHERSKHIDVRLHFIRDLVESKTITIEKILGDENSADFGTKIVPVNKFTFCRKSLHIGEAG